MTQFQILENYLHSQEMDATLAVTDTLLRIAGACEGISKLVARGPLPGCLDAARGDDRELTVQKELDQVANSCLIAALQATPVAYLVSEQLDQAMPMQESAPLSVAIAPLNGSSGLEANAAPGTIFSIYATASAESSSIHDVVCQR